MIRRFSRLKNTNIEQSTKFLKFNVIENHIQNHKSVNDIRNLSNELKRRHKLKKAISLKDIDKVGAFCSRKKSTEFPELLKKQKHLSVAKNPASSRIWKKSDILLLRRCEYIKIRGPSESAFLVEVLTHDIEDSKRRVSRLLDKTLFCLDDTVIDNFVMKAVLVAEAHSGSDREKIRRGRIHAIAAGADYAQCVPGSGRIEFVGSIMMATKGRAVLEKIGYKIDYSWFGFLAKGKVILSPHMYDKCQKCLEKIRKSPQVISIIHNI